MSAGPERVGSTIREALAKGADRAIHIVCDDLGERDALGVARLLAEAIKPENPDLVLTGLQSEDLGLGQTGVIVAELLGLPHATLILQVEKTERGPQSEARTGRGMVSDHRDADARGADDAIGREQAALCHADGHQAGQDQRDARGERSGHWARRVAAVVALEQISVPKKQKSTQMLGGSAKEAAAALVEKLKTEARVL